MAGTGASTAELGGVNVRYIGGLEGTTYCQVEMPARAPSDVLFCFGSWRRRRAAGAWSRQFRDLQRNEALFGDMCIVMM